MAKACVLATYSALATVIELGARLIGRPTPFDATTMMAWLESDLVSPGSQLQQIVIEGESVWFKHDLDT